MSVSDVDASSRRLVAPAFTGTAQALVPSSSGCLMPWPQVAARHLVHFGYTVGVHYPKRPTRDDAGRLFSVRRRVVREAAQKPDIHGALPVSLSLRLLLLLLLLSLFVAVVVLLCGCKERENVYVGMLPVQL